LTALPPGTNPRREAAPLLTGYHAVVTQVRSRRRTGNHSPFSPRALASHQLEMVVPAKIPGQEPRVWPDVLHRCEMGADARLWLARVNHLREAVQGDPDRRGEPPQAVSLPRQTAAVILARQAVDEPPRGLRVVRRAEGRLFDQSTQVSTSTATTRRRMRSSVTPSGRHRYAEGPEARRARPPSGRSVLALVVKPPKAAMNPHRRHSD